MGFFSGRVSFARHLVDGAAPGLFGPEHLARLDAHAAGKQRLASADGVEVGWTAGDHVLDTRFEQAKNVVNDTLHFCLRTDVTKIPADLMRAYYQVELEGLSAANPSGHPSARQKKEARENARDKLEDEAKDGRYTRRKVFPILWDTLSNELLVGSTAVSSIDRLFGLFEKTFAQKFEALTAGKMAYRLAELRSQTRAVDDARPSPFVPGVTPADFAWVLDEASRDFLGNEFLLWLWYHLADVSDEVQLSDGSEVVVMVARTLVLECPRGQTGHETIASDAPARLPEAKRAVQAGKLPRKAGLTLVRHDAQYDLTLQAETLAVSGLKLPPPSEEDDRARLEERVNQLRHLIETLDLLYDAFGRLRCSDEWSKELTKIQKWLMREERPRVSAVG
jgi:recombination associated protein RdgC